MKKNQTKIILLIVLSILQACSTARNYVLPKLEIINKPPLNEVRQAELGDPIVSKGKVFIYDAMFLRNSVTAGNGCIFEKMIVPPGILIPKQDNLNWTYYFSDDFSAYDSVVGTMKAFGGIKVSKNNNKVKVFNSAYYFSLSPSTNPDFTIRKLTAKDKPSFQQELLFIGRIGDYANFLYRESSGDILTGVLSEKLQYDLTDSNVIVFKGARIELIEVTNTDLKYKVLSSFLDTL